jgi:transcriptional regulator with XRE-family HTH domain
MSDLIEANKAINEVYERIGERIAQVRKSAGLNQADVAAAVGLARSSIANIESGRQRPPMHTYLLIAQGFGVSLGELVGEAELPTLAERLPEGGALVVKLARAHLSETASELMRLVAKLEDLDA